MNLIKKRLSQIYKARQCTDVIDVEIALEELKKLARVNGDYTPAMWE